MTDTNKEKPQYDNKKHERTFYYAWMIWLGAGVLDYLDGAVIFVLYFVRVVVEPLSPIIKEVLRLGLFPASAIFAIIYDCVALLTALLDKTHLGKYKKENWIRVAVNTLTAILAVGAVAVGLTLGAAGSLYTLAMYGVNLTVSSLYQFISMTYHYVHARKLQKEINKAENITPPPLAQKMAHGIESYLNWIYGVGVAQSDALEIIKQKILFQLTGKIEDITTDTPTTPDSPEEEKLKKLKADVLSRRNKALSHFIVGITSILVAASGFAVGTLGLPYLFALGVAASMVGAIFFSYAFVRDFRNQRAADKQAAEDAKNTINTEKSALKRSSSYPGILKEMTREMPLAKSASALDAMGKVNKPSASRLIHLGEPTRTTHKTPINSQPQQGQQNQRGSLSP